jgi:hypothetical protein
MMLMAPFVRLKSIGESLMTGILEIVAIGASMKSAMAIAKETTIISTLPAVSIKDAIFLFAAGFLPLSAAAFSLASAFFLSSSSNTMSVERDSALNPQRSASKRFIVPRTTGIPQTLTLFVIETKGNDSVTTSPSGLRTAQAMRSLLRIMTPSTSACPPTVSFREESAGNSRAGAANVLNRGFGIAIVNSRINTNDGKGERLFRQ